MDLQATDASVFLFTSSSMTVTNCAQICLNLQFSHAIVQADDCGCTNSLAGLAVTNRSAMLCDIECDGALRQECGGVAHSSVYGTSELPD